MLHQISQKKKQRYIVKLAKVSSRKREIDNDKCVIVVFFLNNTFILIYFPCITTHLGSFDNVSSFLREI